MHLHDVCVIFTQILQFLAEIWDLRPINAFFLWCESIFFFHGGATSMLSIQKLWLVDLGRRDWCCPVYCMVVECHSQPKLEVKATCMLKKKKRKVFFSHKHCIFVEKFEIWDKSVYLCDVKVLFLHKPCSFGQKLKI
jgi:hypothetical protein